VTTAIITATYGGYDAPKPLPADHGFDVAVYVTDVPVEVEGWTVVVEPSTLHPRLAAKTAKCAPWRYVDADASVWIDGAYSVASPQFRDAVDEHLAQAPFVVWEHPEDRDCLYAEAVFCRDWPKYRDWPIRAQTDHYRATGMPEHYGLWACGTVARRHTAEQRELGEAWLTEQHRWSIQDQVSLPFLLWQRDLLPATWGHPQWSNPWLAWSSHRDDN
jgi:hypothetical protein